MEKPQETMEERFDKLYVFNDGFYHQHSGERKPMKVFIREEITRAIEAREREIAEKVKELRLKADSFTSPFRAHYQDALDDVLALLTKQ